MFEVKLSGLYRTRPLEQYARAGRTPATLKRVLGRRAGHSIIRTGPRKKKRVLSWWFAQHSQRPPSERAQISRGLLQGPGRSIGRNEIAVPGDNKLFFHEVAMRREITQWSRALLVSWTVLVSMYVQLELCRGYRSLCVQLSPHQCTCCAGLANRAADRSRRITRVDVMRSLATCDGS